MRYHIDTIPVWDAVKLGGECPLCALRRKNERQDIDRFLGASVMESDTRVRVNEAGFCAHHQAMLFEKQNRLGHALLMHSRFKEVIARLDAPLKRAAQSAGALADAPALKRLTGRAEGAGALRAAAGDMAAQGARCIVCESLRAHMDRYCRTFFHLYKTDESFRAAMAASKGLCVPDTALLLEKAPDELSGERLRECCAMLTERLAQSLARIEKELEWFTLKFDYRNQDKPFGESRDALERAVNKLRGYCVGAEPDGGEVRR